MEETSGVKLIAAERERQVSEEGWTAEHDDEHAQGELAVCAACYVIGQSAYYARAAQNAATPDGESRLFPWPFELTSWKPTPDDRIRELTKAGALIAAEIDRLQRAVAARAAGKDGVMEAAHDDCQEAVRLTDLEADVLRARLTGRLHWMGAEGWMIWPRPHDFHVDELQSVGAKTVQAATARVGGLYRRRAKGPEVWLGDRALRTTHAALAVFDAR
jgi:hypothetical protein